MQRPAGRHPRAPRASILVLATGVIGSAGSLPGRQSGNPIRVAAAIRRTVATLLLSLGTGACGSDPAPARLERLALAPVDGGLALPEPRPVRSLRLPDQTVPWLLEGPDVRVEALAGGERVIQARLGVRVTIPGPFDPSTFQVVAVHGVFRGAHSLHLSLNSQGAPRVALKDTSEDGAEQEQVHLFEFPDLRLATAPIGEIVLSVRGADCELASLELIDVPLERALPLPESPGMVLVGNEARLAAGLASDRPLEARCVPSAGDQLRFSVAQPRIVAGSGGKLSLSLVLSAGRLQRQRRFELEPDPRGELPWRELRLELDGFEGHETSVVFELAPEGGRPSLVALGQPRLVRDGAKPASVLLVTSDTHRADHVGAYRQDGWLQTPTIDALARRGVLFEDCYATINSTLPSHAALMTGWFPRDTRVTQNASRLADEASTLAEAFRDAGFATYAVVSAEHLGPLISGMDQGFDRMAQPAGNTWPAAEAIDALEPWLAEAAGQPHFVWLHLFDAHTPYEPPAPFDRRYYPADKDPGDPSLPDPGIPDLERRPELRGLRDLSFPVAQYAAEVTYLDHQLERVLSHPRLREGVVALTGDHGEVFAHHGTFFDHRGLWPDTLHVPLVIAWPGAPAGTRVSRPVQNVDLGRTLLDLAGLRSVEFPGTNLISAAERAVGAEEPRFALHAYGSAASITLGRWSLVLALDDYGANEQDHMDRHTLVLFDRIADPEARIDRAGDEPELARRLREALVRWLQEGQTRSLSSSGQHSAESLARLAALGYAVGAEPFQGTSWIDPDCGCSACSRWH